MPDLLIASQKLYHWPYPPCAPNTSVESQSSTSHTHFSDECHFPQLWCLSHIKLLDLDKSPTTRSTSSFQKWIFWRDLDLSLWWPTSTLHCLREWIERSPRAAACPVAITVIDGKRVAGGVRANTEITNSSVSRRPGKPRVGIYDITHIRVFTPSMLCETGRGVAGEKQSPALICSCKWLIVFHPSTAHGEMPIPRPNHESIIGNLLWNLLCKPTVLSLLVWRWVVGLKLIPPVSCVSKLCKPFHMPGTSLCKRRNQHSCHRMQPAHLHAKRVFYNASF